MAIVSIQMAIIFKFPRKAFKNSTLPKTTRLLFKNRQKNIVLKNLPNKACFSFDSILLIKHRQPYFYSSQRIPCSGGYLLIAFFKNHKIDNLFIQLFITEKTFLYIHRNLHLQTASLLPVIKHN